MKILGVLLLLIATTVSVRAAEPDHKARMKMAFNFAMAMNNAIADAKPLEPVKPTPVAKTCLCSGLCECGCNDGVPCDCKGAKPQSRETVNSPVQEPTTTMFITTPTETEYGGQMEARLFRGGSRNFRINRPAIFRSGRFSAGGGGSCSS